MWYTFSITEADDANDGIYFNVDLNDTDRSWLTEILSERLIVVDNGTDTSYQNNAFDNKIMTRMQKNPEVKSKVTELLTVHKKKKECARKQEVGYINKVFVFSQIKDIYISQYILSPTL